MCVHFLEQAVAARAIADGHHNAHVGEVLQIADSLPKQPVVGDGVEVRDAVDGDDLSKTHGSGRAAEFRHLEDQCMRSHAGTQML
mmetsp:Transcript_40706/g.118783  ORF Transcript_40706/g.118783 Transcript_40706/m.118783 type:complete len:85 (+) Transcript_40706:98-352(+)